jgi:hypothetical protein
MAGGAKLGGQQCWRPGPLTSGCRKLRANQLPATANTAFPNGRCRPQKVPLSKPGKMARTPHPAENQGTSRMSPSSSVKKVACCPALGLGSLRCTRGRGVRGVT